MENSSQPGETAGIPTHRARRLWLWFCGGFLLVFGGMLLLVKLMTLHPSGGYVVEVPLWHYYAIRVPQLFGPNTLGLGTGHGAAVIETGLFHLLFSAVGGCVGVAVGWWVRRKLT